MHVDDPTFRVNGRETAQLTLFEQNPALHIQAINSASSSSEKTRKILVSDDELIKWISR